MKTSTELVETLGESDAITRFQAFMALTEMGGEALPAITDGLRHGNWQVRRWCAMYLDHYADGPSLHALIPLLRDPKAKVRLWAVHSLSCDRCKTGENPIDVVPHLLERVEVDESIKVRRMAVAMLAERSPDRRAIPVLKQIERSEEDRKLRMHAERALTRYREGGLDC